jgi:hypothetical protein
VSAGTEGASEWRRAVRVREDPALAAELEQRRSLPVPRPSVGVTDLLALRRAYWRLSGPPVPVSPERQARLESGRFLHRQVERVIAPDGAFEVRVRREGLVGRIDAVSDRPIELKTTTEVVAPEDLVGERPEQVEQLGMYCALLGRSEGRLVSMVARDETVEEVRSYNIAYRDLASILGEMHARASALRECLRLGRPEGLPRCRWYGRGCEYRAASACDCNGTEPPPSDAILERTGRVDPDPAADAALRPALVEALQRARPPSIRRFRDIIYPRRAYFERVRPLSEVAPAVPARDEGKDAYRELIEAVESGPVGEVTRLSSLAEEPEEEVGAFQGTPFLVRTSRARSPPTAEELLDRAPQYALELGFRCAATGTSSARAIVSYPVGGEGIPRIRVFAFQFEPISTFARLWRQRVRGLEGALRSNDPSPLPPCPAWMFADCPYRDACACAPDPGRSQR